MNLKIGYFFHKRKLKRCIQGYIFFISFSRVDWNIFQLKPVYFVEVDNVCVCRNLLGIAQTVLSYLCVTFQAKPCCYIKSKTLRRFFENLHHDRFLLNPGHLSINDVYVTTGTDSSLRFHTTDRLDKLTDSLTLTLDDDIFSTKTNVLKRNSIRSFL